MPVHYGSKEHHFHTISSPLATQFPQAAGAAYALKRTPGRENSCVVCYAGEGATSEGDFHAGLNSASFTLSLDAAGWTRALTAFAPPSGKRSRRRTRLCRPGPSRSLFSLHRLGLTRTLLQNNGCALSFDEPRSFSRARTLTLSALRSFAISTPTSQQYAGDGIASRGPGYGIDTIRVDGNDPLAVFLACKEARRRAVEGKKPVLVEVRRRQSLCVHELALTLCVSRSQAMTYRVGHHSTSDDSSAYRSLSAVESVKKLDSPLFRLRRYLESLPEPRWSTERDNMTKDAAKRAILREFSKAEKDKKPALAEMFGDVFARVPEGAEREGARGGLERPQREQKEELKRLIEKWGDTPGWKKELAKFDGGKEAVSKW